MLEKLHEHVIAEIEQSNRTDTLVVVVTIFFNVITLCSNSTVSAIMFNMGAGDVSAFGINLYLGVMVALTIGLNAIALAGLLTGRKVREKLLAGLVTMYSDNKVEKYYDKTLIANYRARYRIFSGLTLLFAAAAIVVPLILRSLRLS